jgi:hypothetical protein
MHGFLSLCAVCFHRVYDLRIDVRVVRKKGPSSYMDRTHVANPHAPDFNVDDTMRVLGVRNKEPSM